MKVGVDIVETNRFEKMQEIEQSLSKVYTEYEIKHIGKAAKTLPRMAGLYAAKEAVVKALGIGLFGGLVLNEIEIRHDDNGRPYLNLTDKVKAIFKEHGVSKADVSISHTDSYAVAICVLE